ncbi:YqiJ family protein [Sphingomonas sp. KRR8]|uniref:YqiJ family protein n=1 Tax=Sphingomonas sp. KRR8 TaxID=2942996 RepID=UPI0020227FA9|nr:YqiJ family protein [Sphingomonas sp. KRR8]URD60725.1 YqiJ family protein [Sphingomonas sp. KRR8]
MASLLLDLLTPAYIPFVISFVVMLGIGLIEAVGLGLGHIDVHPDVTGDADADGATLLDWLGLGEMPVLIWLTALLACFTLLGLATQQVAAAWLGAPLSPAIAAVGAGVGGLILNTYVSSGLARILPGLETTAITSDELLRLRGTVLEGTARRGRPARAKVVDRFGQAHYVMIEPHEDSDTIAQGETALLVRHEGSLFFALPDVSQLRAS